MYTAESKKVLFEECDIETGYLLGFQEIDSLLAPQFSAKFLGTIQLPAASSINLSKAQVDELGTEFKIFPTYEGALCKLEIVQFDKDLPYLMHTNRELALMRQGIKPFAVFSGYQISDVEKIVYSKHFDSLVAAGHFSVREYNLTAGRRLSPGSRFNTNFTLTYAIKGEEWRMDTYVLLRNTVAHVGLWSDDYERIFGSLLGYKDVENDAWIARRAAWGLRWGYATIYFRLTTEDLCCLEKSGLEGLSRESNDAIDFYISQEGITPILDKLGVAKCSIGAMKVARFNFPFRSLRLFKDLSSDLQKDQFGPFSIKRKKINDLSRLVDGKIEILPLGS